VQLAKQYSADAKRVIDVGPGRSRILLDLDWIPEKTAIDLKEMPRLEGVENIHRDFLEYVSDKKYDLVLCLQVLEHLEDPDTFAKKLLKTGRTVIISVPYKWPKGACKWHLQDPVTEKKIKSWIGKDWADHRIVSDEDGERIIVVYE
jgi:2-polyprenyl-3-methyl-5-hydroxy-6-metoxy-1,4-benzoquinol methylase